MNLSVKIFFDKRVVEIQWKLIGKEQYCLYISKGKWFLQKAGSTQRAPGLLPINLHLHTHICSLPRAQLVLHMRNASPLGST